MEIVDIQDRSDLALRLFRILPQSVYENDPIWAPGSDTVFESQWADRHHPAILLFQPVVAVEARRPVARGVAILRAGAAAPDGSVEGYIGFFECQEGRPDAAARVLARCEGLLRSHGAGSVVAPRVDNQLSGCQVGGFELPHLCLTPHNPPAYSDHFTSAGYVVRDRLLSIVFTRDTAFSVDVALPGFTTREFDRTRLEAEIRTFHDLQAAIFQDRPGYVPRSLDEDRKVVGSLLPFLSDDLVIIAEDRTGLGVGILVCLPDFYQQLAGQTVTRLRLLTIGARPGFQKRGIGVLMASHLLRNLSTRPHILFAEASVILSRNLAPQNLAKRFNGHPGRSFVVFSKAL